MASWRRSIRKKFNYLFTSFRAKTIAIAIIGLLLSMLLMIVISQYGIRVMSRSALEDFENSIDDTTYEYMDNYISTTASFMEEDIYSMLAEQAILGGIVQKITDMEEEFSTVNSEFAKMDYFKDVLSYNGRWYQNESTEPTVLLVQRYLLDGKNKIRPEVQQVIDSSIYLDLLLPAFQEEGIAKEWVYFTGPENGSFLRVAPWSDIGSAIDSVYPEHTDHPNWNYFNPGLLSAWAQYMEDHPLLKKDLSRLAIMSEPSQDGGTGEMIITMRHPIWNMHRDTVIGAISYDISLNQKLASIEDIILGSSGFAFISDQDKNVIAINEAGMRTLGLEKTGITKETSGYNRLNRAMGLSDYDSVKEIELPQSREMSLQTIKIDGEELIIVQKRLSSGLSYSLEKGMFNNYWTLGFVVPKTEFYSAFYDATVNVENETGKILVYQALLAVITAVFMAAIIFDFNRGATEDLEKLLKVTEAIKERNYDVEVNVESKDEFGRLAVAFRSMIQEIKLTVHQLYEHNQRLEEEIEERKRKEKIIDYLESYDSLTNLPNLNVFMRTIDEQIHLVKRADRIGGVMVLGIDDFRRVNEVYSHEIGDRIFKAITERLSREIRNPVIISKLKGDEFGIVISPLNEVQELIVHVEQVLEIFKESFKIDDKEIFITTSVGISTFPSDGLNSPLLFKNASSALVNAKEINRSSYSFFDNDLNNEAKEKMNLLTDLRYAIDSDELILHYQPIVDVKSEVWIGMEALVRWHHPERGLVPPSKFIPVAEEANIIGNISRWVLKKACNDLKVVHNNGFENFRVSVNISPNDLKEDQFVDEIITLVTEVDIPPKSLSLEITEGVFIGNFERTAEIFRRLRQFGIKISVDDFGTGYSSLSYIRKLPVNCLKIDQSFIRGIPDKDEGTIAHIINNLAKEVRLQVIAEGVESEEQLDFLKKRNVDEAQGYYFSKPMSIDIFSLALIEHFRK